MSLSDDQVRFNILELLNKRVSDNPASLGTDRAIIQDLLKVSEKQMDDNMHYLEEKALVALSRTKTSQWTFAKITADGIDVMENKERYTEKFPFLQTSTSQIPQEGTENLPQKPQSETSFIELSADAFKQARDQVRGAKISNSDKEKIEKQLKALEKELQKAKKADLTTIQKCWEWLKKNANWLTPTIGKAVLEGIRTSLELP